MIGETHVIVSHPRTRLVASDTQGIRDRIKSWLRLWYSRETRQGKPTSSFPLQLDTVHTTALLCSIYICLSYVQVRNDWSVSDTKRNTHPLGMINEPRKTDQNEILLFHSRISFNDRKLPQVNRLWSTKMSEIMVHEYVYIHRFVLHTNVDTWLRFITCD